MQSKYFLVCAGKKRVASVRWSQIVDGQHWFIRSKEALDCIITLADRDGNFSIFIGRLSVESATGLIVMTQTTNRENAQRFSYSSAHSLAYDLSQQSEREIRVERISSQREIA